MALAPRSSLRSLVLLMSHGKPRLSSFFSSAATGVPPAAPGPGADAPPAAPAVQSPAPPGRSCPKLPVEEEFVLNPIHGGPCTRPHPRGAVKDVTDKACLNAPEDPTSAYPVPDHASSSTPKPVSDKPPWDIFEETRHPIRDPPRPRAPRAVRDVAGKACPNAPEDPSAYTTPGYGSCSTPEPDKPPCGASEDVKQRDVDPPPPAREGVGHRVVDPPRRGRGRRAVPDEPEQCAQEHPKYPVPDSSSDEVFSSCSSAVPPPCTPAAPDVQPPDTPALPDRSSHKLPDHEESVVNPLPDPPSGNRLSPVIEEPAQCTLDNPKYPTPDHGSCSPSEGASGDLLEDLLHPLRDPPRRP